MCIGTFLFNAEEELTADPAAMDAVGELLDEAVCGINDLQEEFDENDSEIETVARECIAANVAFWRGSASLLTPRRPSEKGTGENNVH